MPNDCAPIPGDPFGRFSVDVTIQAPPIPPGQQGPATHSTTKKLAADTGGATIIPKENVAAWGLTLGPGTNGNFGPLFDLMGAEMIVQVQDYGAGNTHLRACKNIKIHTLGAKGFAPCEGLLGMDQFDALQADPAKLTDGTPYLCVRPAPKADASAAKTAPSEVAPPGSGSPTKKK